MSDDELETRVMSGGLPPLPDADETRTPPRMPDHVRRARLRSDLMRWSEASLAGQIARAVARGQRVM